MSAIMLTTYALEGISEVVVTVRLIGQYLRSTAASERPTSGRPNRAIEPQRKIGGVRIGKLQSAVGTGKAREGAPMEQVSGSVNPVVEIRNPGHRKLEGPTGG